MRALAIATLLVLVASVAWGQAFTEDFEAGVPPAGWIVTDNAGDGVVWTTASSYGEGNYTGGSGDCAMCDSDAAGSGIYLDTELITHTFTVPGAATLEFDANYQNLAGSDYFDVDIDVGAGWVNLLSWNEDHGGFGAPPGEHVVLDLAGFAGETAAIRFHYYDPNGTGWDWYIQVDQVELTGTTPVERTTWGSIKSLYR
jgi:hypothetical protein